jgi:hypothetical protein
MGVADKSSLVLMYRTHCLLLVKSSTCNQSESTEQSMFACVPSTDTFHIFSSIPFFSTRQMRTMSPTSNLCLSSDGGRVC